MRNDHRAILSLVALGRVTPAEAERLLIACDAGRESFWIFAVCVAAALSTLVPRQSIAALLHVTRILLADDSLRHALSFIHRLLGGIQ